MSKGKSGGAQAQPSAEYQQYQTQWQAQNQTKKVAKPSTGMVVGGMAGDKTQAAGAAAMQRMQDKANKQPTNGPALPYQFKGIAGNYSGWSGGSAPDYDLEYTSPGDYTGQKMMSEADYYSDKSQKQQEAYIAQMDARQKEFQQQLEASQANMQSAFDNQMNEYKSEQERIKAENEAKAAAAKAEAERKAIQQAEELQRRRDEEYRTAQISKRDAMMADRLSAEEASVDYVNDQIAKEKSNAALFGIEYKIGQTQKDQRVSDYFSSVWGEGDETNLSALFDEVGRPEGFTDFNVKRGSKFLKDKEKVTNKLVGRSNGIRGGRNTAVKSIISDDNRRVAASILGG